MCRQLLHEECVAVSSHGCGARLPISGRMRPHNWRRPPSARNTAVVHSPAGARRAKGRDIRVGTACVRASGAHLSRAGHGGRVAASAVASWAHPLPHLPCALRACTGESAVLALCGMRSNSATGAWPRLTSGFASFLLVRISSPPGRGVLTPPGRGVLTPPGRGGPDWISVLRSLIP